MQLIRLPNPKRVSCLSGFQFFNRLRQRYFFLLARGEILQHQRAFVDFVAAENRSERNSFLVGVPELLIHFDFLLAVIVMTFLGPMLPILATRWGISDAVAGRLFLTQFISSMFGMMLSAYLVKRKGYRTTFVVGLVLMACGMSLLASGPFLLGITAVAALYWVQAISSAKRRCSRPRRTTALWLHVQTCAC